jgi:hypothetical protein
MAIQLVGAVSGIGVDVESASNAMRVTQRPIDIGSLGSYSILASSGTMAAGLAAASPVFAFRFADASKFALIRRVRLDMVSLGTGFAAGVALFDLIIARSWSASDTGGTAVSMASNNGKRKTAFGTSLVTDMRISSTATLTAGTRTLDANALAALRFGVSTAANATQLLPTDIWLKPPSDWPVVFTNGEGFVIRATVPATGTWQFDVTVDWDEVAAYQ